MQSEFCTRVWSRNSSVWSDSTIFKSSVSEFSKEGDRRWDLFGLRGDKDVEVCCIELDVIDVGKGFIYDCGDYDGGEDGMQKGGYRTTTRSITTTTTAKGSTNPRDEHITPTPKREAWWKKIKKLASWPPLRQIARTPQGKDVILLPSSTCSSYPSDTKTPSHTTTFLPPSIPPPPPHTPITCTFQLPTHTHTRHIPYPLYRHWQSFSSLLQILTEDFGMPVLQLWDSREGMEIQSGDWEARVRPGWEVIVVCGECDVDDDEDDDDEEEEEEDWDESDEEGESKRKIWWFRTWRTKVESGGGDRIKIGRRGWACVLGIVGTIALIAFHLVF